MGRSTKLLGAWGYLALVAGGFLGLFVGPLTGLITLAGAVCVLVAFYRAADELNLPSIKHEITIAIVLNVIASVLIFFVVVAAVVAYFARERQLDHFGPSAAVAFGGGTAFAALVAWVLTIFGSWFWYKASASLTRGTGVETYKTGGLLIFVGSITIIVFGIGLLVRWAGEIVQTVAFFSTPEGTGEAIQPPSPPES